MPVSSELCAEETIIVVRAALVADFLMKNHDSCDTLHAV